MIRISFPRIWSGVGLLVSLLCVSGHAQVSKGNWILLNRGLQLQGMCVNYDSFHLTTYSNANYTSINWLWDSDTSQQGTAPGFPWARWVRTNSPTEMPPLASETAYTSQLVMLQLGDEWPLNDLGWRDALVNWFKAVSNNFPNTILFHNSYGSQVSDTNIGDFITRGHPDMICFDTYPWQSEWNTSYPNNTGPVITGPPTGWYGDMRRYRQWGFDSKIPVASYRQTFHAVQDYDYHVFRDPSPSELRLNTFAALAFNAKTLIDFKYNSGGSLFTNSFGGDNAPNSLYYEMADANLRARNLGKALLRLQPIYDLHNPTNSSPPPGPASDDTNFPSGITTSIMFLRGRSVSGGVTNFWPVPNSFANDPSSAANPGNPNNLVYTWWESDKNDPYLRGWVVTNKAAVKNDGLPGDVIIAWFKPLDESFDGPTYTNQLYFMVVNGLTDPTGSAADCMQEIKLNFLNTFSDIIMLDPVSGQLQTNTLPIVSTRRQLVLDLNGGDAALFKIATGAPFVGWPTPAQLSVQMQSGKPAVTLQGMVAARYQLQYSPTPPATSWTTLTNLLLPSSPYTFLDTTTSGATKRFYRAVGISP
jgi:hypothetical protein